MQIYTDKYFENPAEIIEIFDPEKVKEGIDRVEKLRDSGFFLLGYMRYNLLDPASFEEIRQASEAVATATFCDTLGGYMATALGWDISKPIKIIQN